MRFKQNYFLILLFLCVLGGYLILPYSIILQGKPLSVITPKILLLIGFQNLIIYSFVIYFGLCFARKININFLLLTHEDNYKKNLILPSFLGAVISAISIFILDIFVFKQPFKDLVRKIDFIYSLVTPIYGAINEEVLLRLFFLSFIAWLIFRFGFYNKNKIMWFSIFLSAFIFGLGHLVIVTKISALTLNLILRTIILNSIPGIIFAWLYWKKSFEAAMLSHFLTDIFLHLILFRIF